MNVSKKQVTVSIVGALALVFLAFGVGRCSAGGGLDRASADSSHEHGHEHGDEAAQTYTCPMHPQIRQDEPGTCPICQMDLVPLDETGADAQTPTVRLSEASRAMARIEHSEVRAGSVSGELAVFGTVAVDEQAEVDLSAWVGGRIERLLVSARGEKVRRGQLLAQVYSPELLSAQRTLLRAAKTLEDAADGDSERRQRAARSSVEASRMELRLLGMDARQIEEIVARGEARETVNIYATAGGTVQSRNVAEGDYVQTGDSILSLAALDTVWAQLEIYEKDLPRVDVGSPVTVTVDALDGEEREGRISFISPEIDAQRRVARARVVLANEDGRLRPGMYVRAKVEISHGDEDTLSIPDTALLWTGPRSLVYRYDSQLEPPAYVPEEVSVGPVIGGRQVVVDGLNEGDEVVSRGAFRIDSELQVKGGPSMMSTLHAQGENQGGAEPVEVSDDGEEFDPPIDPERLPDGVWYCDMGTTHWAQHEEGDGICPICNMNLTEKKGESADDDADDDGTEDNETGGHDDHAH